MSQSGRRVVANSSGALAVFGLGSVLGGVTTAAATVVAGGIVSGLPQSVRAATVVLLVVALAGGEYGVLRLRLPENRRQVPSAVFDRGLRRGALQFGFELGTGVRTYMTSYASYVIMTALVLIPPSSAVVLYCGAAFGVGRWVMPACRWASRQSDLWDAALFRSGRALARSATMVTSVVVVAIAVSTVSS